MEVDEDNSNGEVVVLATKNDCTTKELNKKESRKLKRLHREAIQTTDELASDEEDLPPIKDRQDGKDTTTTTQSAIKSATPNGDVKKEDEESSSSDKAQDEGSSSDEAPDESPEEQDHHTSSSSDDSECVITEETTTTTKKDDKKSAEKPSSPPQPDKDGDDDDDDKIQDGGDKEDAPAADDDDVEICSSDSDDQVLADIAVKPTTTKLEEETEKPKPEEKDKSDTTTKGKPPPNKRPRRGSKEQTIIVTETKSLAQAINEAVKKPDGKPTLVIIETKTPSSTNASSNGMVSTSSNVSSSSSTTTSTTKSIAKVPPSSSQMPSSSSVPSHNSLRSALLQGSGGMATRSQNRPSVISQSSSAAAKPSSKTEAPQQQGLALKDDAEINVYTPSLLVPYLFECPPKEYLKDFLKKIAPPEVVKAEEEKKKEEQKALDDCEPPLPKLPTKPKTFFDTSLGQFFVDIGLSQVQQWVQSEIYKSEKKKLDRGWKTKDRERMVKNLQKTLVEIRHKNSPFEFVMKRCKRCNFATESKIVMERHLETIHMDGARMQCSFCNFETIDPSQIFQHLFSQHKAFGRLERPPNTHMCPMCPFEDSAKARVTRHSWKCTKTFVPEKNMCPPPDFEPPAKRIRHVASVATLKAMRAGVEKSDGGSSATPGGPGQNRSSGSLLTPLLAQQRGPPPIRPKPGDLRLTPTYVQSVLRGSYVPPNRAPYPGILTTPGGLVRTSTPLQGSSSGGSASFLASRGGSQQSSANSPAYSLQGNQIYQVVHTSGSSNVPVFRGGAVTSFTPPRFTILPTPPAMVNTRGPTPVALIPNLATNTKPGSGTGPSGTSSGIKSGAVSVSSTGSLHASVTPTGLSKKIGAQAASHLSSKPNISITPVSKPVPGRSSMSGSQTSKAGITPVLQSQQGRQGGQQQQNNPSYVVCEICDGYIKDLDQLRNHMQWIHKVKIHPKMIHNRPPLNCQKCHFRFFTDQGLERHLLGSHGLVTSSMQENANKGKDGGRCIICGKVFLWKLVVHMAKDHKMTLKPAHLSYKCTVCSATFNMYRLFETHVYEEHSTVAKRVLDGQKTYPSLPSSQTSSTKAKVTITPTSAASSSSSAASIRNNKSIVVTPVTSEKSGGGSGAVAEVRCPPAELRPCKECGVKFQPAFNCVGHPDGKAPVKPCHIKLCRVDRCAKCVSKAEQAEEAESGGALNGKPKRDHGDVKHESSSGGKSGSGATSKTSGGPPAKIKTETEHESKDSTKTAAADAVTTDQSDGDDVFDMEVETVDDDHPSPGDVHTDVESD